jgi:hypothetical protein
MIDWISKVSVELDWIIVVREPSRQCARYTSA